MDTLYHYLLLSLALGWVGQVAAQPAIDWNATFGGSNYEEANDSQLHPDGGFLVLGNSASTIGTGNISEAQQGATDLTLIYKAQDGTLLWQARVGGDDREFASEVLVDGEQIVVFGSSFSDATGSKTSSRVAAGNWASDVFAVGFDLLGNKLWDASYGGRNSESTRGAVQGQNGNYFIIATTDSDTDAGTNRIEPLIGGRDLWLLEIDSLGQVVSEHIYGGLGDENAWGIHALPSGNLMLYGSSVSDAGGTKTRPSFGSSDMWLVEVRLDGSVVQDFQFGGTEQENPFVFTTFSDGDYFVGGQSLSPPSGNKSTAMLGPELDFWCVRFGPDGTIRWDQTYGGSDLDDIYTLGQNINDYVLLAGTTRSSDRPDGAPVVGREDAWLIYISPEGELIWDIVRGGDQNESIRSILRSEDGGWYFSGISGSNGFDWKNADGFGTLDGNGIRPNDAWLGKLECDYRIDLGTDDINVCSSLSVTLKNQAGGRVLANTSYLWSDGSIDSTFTLTATVDTIVSLQAVSPDACEARDTIRVDVHANPSVTALDVVPETCEGLRDGSIFLEPSLDTEGLLLDGQVVSTPLSIDSLSSGSFTFVLRSTYEPCNLDTTVQLEAAGGFTLDLGQDLEVAIGTELTLDPNPSTSDSLTYQWSGLSNLCPDCKMPTVRILESGLVIVEATDLNGCTSQSRIVINGTADRNVQAPNAISPNDDGSNDRFAVFMTPFVERAGPLRIFDRWGNQLFVGLGGQITDLNQGWDGTFRGEPVNPGVYTYILPIRYLDGQERVIRGEINLLR